MGTLPSVSDPEGASAPCAMTRRRVCALITALSLSLPIVTRASERLPPELPVLNLNELPATIRSVIQDVYDRARQHPDDASAVGRLAMMLQAYDQHRSAAACYQAAHRLEPTVLSWAYLLGVERAELAEYPSAIRSLRAALTIDADYLPARIRLADALMTAGDLDGSFAEYSTLTRRAPDLAIAHYGLGRVAMARRDPPAAADHYKRAVAISPQFGAAHYALALAYRDAGLNELAAGHADEFRRWGSRRPRPPDPLLDSVKSLRSTARDLLASGSQLAADGRLEEAIALHLKAIEADPTVGQAHVNLISLYGRMNRSEEAEAHYRAALVLNTSVADAHYNYGVLLASMRRDDDAMKAFRQALEVNPFHAQSHYNLASLLAACGHLQQAVSHYQQAVANDPTHRKARLNLGRALVAIGRPREGAEQFERVLQAEDVDAARVLFALSRAWLAANETVKARQAAEEALRRATTLGETDLAASIERSLTTMAAAR